MEEKRSGGEGSGQITRCPVGHGKDARSHGSEWRRERIRIKFHRVPLGPVSGMEARERKESTEKIRLSGSFERPTRTGIKWDYTCKILLGE